MKLARISLVVTLLVASLAITSAQAPKIPGIDASGMDTSVRPQDDFFRYVNGKWVDNTPIPADQSTYGTFAILRDRAQEAVRGISTRRSCSRGCARRSRSSRC